jgi:hypothetical protein
MPYRAPVSVFWDDDQGSTKYVHVKFLDISEGGMRIEVPEPIPIGAHISLRAERMNLVGSAVVKHAVRCGSKYLLGLELSEMLRDQVVALIRDPSAVQPPLPVGVVGTNRYD